MTRKRFIKNLRSIGASEKAIRSYIKLVAQFGGAQSYQSIYDTIREAILKRILYECPPTLIDYKNELTYSNFGTDCYQSNMYRLYDVKPLECGVVINCKGV